MKQIWLHGITIEQLAEALAKHQHKPQEYKSISNDLLTRKQVCDLLNITLTTLWKHTRSGKFKSFGVGKRVYYSREQILEAVKPINH